MRSLGTGAEAFGMPGDLTGRISSTKEGFGKVLRRSLEATGRGASGKARLTGFSRVGFGKEERAFDTFQRHDGNTLDSVLLQWQGLDVTTLWSCWWSSCVLFSLYEGQARKMRGPTGMVYFGNLAKSQPVLVSLGGLGSTTVFRRF